MEVSKRIEVGEIPVLVATSGTAMAIGALISNKENHIQTKLQGYKIPKNNLDSIVKRKRKRQKKMKIPNRLGRI